MHDVKIIQSLLSHEDAESSLPVPHVSETFDTLQSVSLVNELLVLSSSMWCNDDLEHNNVESSFGSCQNV